MFVTVGSAATAAAGVAIAAGVAAVWPWLRQVPPHPPAAPITGASDPKAGTISLRLLAGPCGAHQLRAPDPATGDDERQRAGDMVVQ